MAGHCNPNQARGAEYAETTNFHSQPLASTHLLCYHRTSMQPSLAAQISSELRERFANAKSVFVLTGAGVSAESGVPTFRGGGDSAVWKGMPFDVISSAQMVERDLAAVWEWFDYRRTLLASL